MTSYGIFHFYDIYYSFKLFYFPWDVPWGPLGGPLGFVGRVRERPLGSFGQPSGFLWGVFGVLRGAFGNPFGPMGLLCRLKSDPRDFPGNSGTPLGFILESVFSVFSLFFQRRFFDWFLMAFGCVLDRVLQVCLMLLF